MTPAEFDAACRLLTRKYPELSETSGKRSIERNEMVGGNEQSKHLFGMARDYVSNTKDPDMDYAVASEYARTHLGLWTMVHDVSSGNHLHVQGLPPGPIAGWWVDKYL